MMVFEKLHVIMRKIFIVIISCSISTGRADQSLCEQEDNNLMWIVAQASTAAERTKLAEHGMSLDVIEENSVEGTVPIDYVNAIEKSGFKILSKVSLHDLIALQTKKGLITHFLHYNQVQTSLQQLAHEHADIASLFSMGKSIQGRELWTLRLNTTAKGMQPSKKPGAMFIGTIHAREHLATTVALELARWLCINKNDIRKLLNSHDIYITPLMNPDGSDHDLSGNTHKFYRKNMRVHPDKKIGVDLNRNFGYGWGGRGASAITGSETYRGATAFSEPESRALKQFLEKRDNIKAFISYHSYGEMILYPWGNKSTPLENIQDKNAHINIAQEIAKITGYKPMQASRLYIASGDTTDWTYAARHTISFTIELFPNSGGRGSGSGFYPTDPTQIQKTIENNILAALYVIKVSV